MPSALGKLLVEPVEDPPIEEGAVLHLAMPVRALGGREAHQRLGAAQRGEEGVRAGCERVILCLGDQGGALDELGPALHGEGLGRGKVGAQIVHAMHPEATLDDLPVKPAVLAEMGVDAVEHRLVQGAEFGRRFGLHAELVHDHLPEAFGDAPGGGIGDEGGEARLARGAAGREVPAKAPAVKRSAMRRGSTHGRGSARESTTALMTTSQSGRSGTPCS